MKCVVAVLIVSGTLSRIGYAEDVSPRRLVEIVDFSDPIVSPDGDRVAFRVEQASVERNTYDSTWYVQDVRGTAPPHRIADGGIPLRDLVGSSTPGPVVWSPDGRWVFYRALLNGRIGVWRAAADGSGAEPATRDPANIRDFSLTVDGRYLKYSVGPTRDEIVAAEEAEYDAGIRIDETVPVGQGVFRSGYVDGRLATERYTGRWFELRGLLGNAPDRWKEIDLTTGATLDLSPRDVPPNPLSTADFADVSPQPWRVVDDPRSDRVAVLTRVGDGHEVGGSRAELAVFADRTSRRAIKCSDSLCMTQAITGIQWRSEGEEILFSVTDPHQGGAQSIFRWNVKSGTVRLVVSIRGLIGGGENNVLGSCGVSPASLICVTAEAAQPPRLEKVDFSTGERRVLFDPNAALAQDLARSAPARLLRWRDKKGREFTGQYFPATRAGGTSPLFINYYSCKGFFRGGVGDEFPFATLAEHGIAALCINRLEGFTQDAVERHDEGRAAVESVVAMLASMGEVDPNKVGMGGLSYGGAVALWTATESHLLAAVSVGSPVVTPNYYLFNSLRGEDFSDELMSSWGLGAPDETPARWRAMSPAFKIDRISAPILFQNSEQEYLEELEYALPLVRSHRADLYVFPNEPHIMFQPRHKLAVYERNLDWFGFWLRNVIDPDPGKADQYLRWRLMKASLAKAGRR